MTSTTKQMQPNGKGEGPLGDCGESGLTCSNFRNNRQVNQKPKVVNVLVWWQQPVAVAVGAGSIAVS